MGRGTEVVVIVVEEVVDQGELMRVVVDVEPRVVVVDQKEELTERLLHLHQRLKTLLTSLLWESKALRFGPSASVWSRLFL